MEIFETLGVALGFGVLAGVNLYMTVFVTGLAIHLGWLNIFEKYAELDVLANPWVLGVSGVMFLAETLADKIPWVDSSWDIVHTAIRPVGGVLLAMAAIGELNDASTVIAGLLCGSTSLISHTAKAGTRALINLSPEPVSNIIMSTTEDTAVLGGLALMAFSPVTSFFVFLLIALVGIFVVWKTFKALKKVGVSIRNKFTKKRIQA